jgi:prepilin-type processing-associated H-X9-DG protein
MGNSERAERKIGIARDPKKRVVELSTGHPYPLQVLASHEAPSKQAARNLEQHLHRHFKSRKIHGEWFKDVTTEEFTSAYQTLYNQIYKPQPEKPISLVFYMAGKIQSSCACGCSLQWRGALAPDFAEQMHKIDRHAATTNISMVDGHIYRGPVLTCMEHGGDYGDHIRVMENSFSGIRKADIVLVYVSPDFDTAYGSLVEIGYAAGIKKPVWLIVDPSQRQLVETCMWFQAACAEKIVYASCVLEGFYLLTSGDSVEQRYYLTGKDQYEL